VFFSAASEEPWCPATRTDYDYAKEYVIVDLGCPKTVHKVEGKDPYALLYSGEYSNSKKKWKTLTSEDDTYYDKNFKVSDNVSPTASSPGAIGKQARSSMRTAHKK